MKEQFLTWCDERIAECKREQERLAADGRTDEATMMTIRGNVYGIFRATWTAVKGDPALVLLRLDRIPAAWAARLALAEQHGDAETAHIERVKLDTVACIRDYVIREVDA